MTKPLVDYHSISSYNVCSLSDLLLLSDEWATESFVSFLSLFYLSLYQASVIMTTLSFLSCYYFSLHPSCAPSIIISDPQMTLRQLLFKTYTQQQQTVWWREGKEDRRRGVEWRGGHPLGSQVLSCCAHVLCMGLLCIFQGPPGPGVYIHTRWFFQHTTLYGVCVSVSVCLCMLV